jgi:hypothetical protein
LSRLGGGEWRQQKQDDESEERSRHGGFPRKSGLETSLERPCWDLVNAARISRCGVGCLDRRGPVQWVVMSEPNDVRGPVLVLVRDLIFASRITATAKAEGVAVVVIRDAAQLPGRAGRRLIVDLNQDGSIDAAAAWGKVTGRDVVGFVSHVDAATVARARDAGISRVVARSRFVEELPELLRDRSS